MVLKLENRNKNKNKQLKSIAAFLGLPLIIIVIYAIIGLTTPDKTYNYSEIVANFKNHQVTNYEMNLGSGDMTIVLKNGETLYYTAPSVNLMYSDIKDYIEEYNKENPEAPMSYNLIKANDTSWIASLFMFVVLPVLMLGIFGWLFLRKITAMGDPERQMGFGRAKARNLNSDKRKALFSDVAGADEEKEELAEIVDFLKNPQKYLNLGARIPKGVLLVGPPGTGKTLLARAVAGEAGVPFFSMSGSDFVEMFVGVGASRVRDLFAQAKKNSPSVIFIDEIDAVGRQRGAGLGGGHDEREQTLNQLLVEMDGFGANEGIIVIAATNRPDILDHALTRPGRFDRKVTVGYPDAKGREEILKVHSKGKPLAADVILKDIAKTTIGFTGADLENLMNESAILAAKRGAKTITKSEIEEATIKVSLGAEKKSKIITEEERKETAYHEAGHAIVAYFCDKRSKVQEISTIPRGIAGGYTLYLPEKEDNYPSKNRMLTSISVALGGMAAEKVIFKDTTAGVYGDLKSATKTAKSMVKKYGMSEVVGPVIYGSSGDEVFIGRDMGHVKDYSESTACKIDDEVRRIITECSETAERIIKENIDKLHEIANYLIENEKMSAEKFALVMQGEKVDSDASNTSSEKEPGHEDNTDFDGMGE